MSDTETTQGQQRGLVPWQKGQSGNPAGRPKGSRNKFANAFIDDFYADWQENGAAVIAQVRAEKPADYLRIAAGILPQKIEIERFDNLSDDERSSRIRELAEQLGLAAAIGLAGGTAGTAGGGEEGPRPHEAASVSTLQ